MVSIKDLLKFCLYRTRPLLGVGLNKQTKVVFRGRVLYKQIFLQQKYF